MAVHPPWHHGELTSQLHIAQAVCNRKPIVVAELATTCRESVLRLVPLLETVALASDRFWPTLLHLSVDTSDVPKLVHETLRSLGAAPRALALQVAAEIEALRLTIDAYLPRLKTEMPLRQGPLREQWEARGAGMMARLVRLTRSDCVKRELSVLAVYPVCGGGGEIHWPSSSLRIEAVLANPVAELPEVVRLTWLFACWGLIDALQSAGSISESLRDAMVAATIVATLTAAEDVELASCDPTTITLAARNWNQSQFLRRIDAASLLDWWTDFQQSPSQEAWPSAVVDLANRLNSRPYAAPDD